MASLSVIVRTIGHTARLSEALESLVAQTRSDFEVVVVDMSGGANDAVLDRFASRLALRRVGIERSARPVALNVGIAVATSPAIAILDDDNLYDPAQIDILLSGLERAAGDYVYAGVRHATYSSGGALVSTREMARPFAFDDLLMGNFVYATGSAFRRSLWEDAGGYDERFAVFEDWEFLIRVAQLTPIVFLDVVTGESRKFTGDDARSNFDREIALVRRCQAGIYWKHRHHYLQRHNRATFRATYAQHFARRRPARTGLLACSVHGWRLELVADLVSWWVA